MKQSNNQGGGWRPRAGPRELGGFGGGEQRPKAGHQGARGQHRAPRPPLPIQCPLSENDYEAQAPPAPEQKHGPANWPIRKWGFGGKEASGGGEGQDAQQPGLSAQGPPPISLGGGAAVWRPAVPSVHLGCANLCPLPAAGSWFLGVPGDGGGDPLMVWPCLSSGLPSPLPFLLSSGLLLLRRLRRILR